MNKRSEPIGSFKAMSDIPDELFDVTLPPQAYPGLRSFEKNEWPIFFGREIITGEVVQRLIDRQFLALHGDSGCGKSSLIRAGVMPRLERDHARGGATWRTISMLPRNAPLHNLAAALAALESTPADPSRITALRRILNLGSKAAAHLPNQLRFGDNDYICVLVDQFEEFFTFAEHGGASEAQQFVDVLTGLQQARAPGLHVILTMRSEFLGRCANFDGLAEAINETQFLLPRMDARALVRAIREPARLYGGFVEPELAEAIVLEAGRGQDQLPLMQHAVMLMHRNVLTESNSMVALENWSLGLAAYRKSGGISALLSEHAESVYSNIISQSGDERITAETLARIFKALTAINADGHAIRRPQTLRELLVVTGGNLEDLLKVLAPLCADDVSFLKIYGQQPYNEDELVDISHEALIRNWPRLREWTTREADDGAVYLRLLGLAAQHRADSSILLGLGEARERDRWWQDAAPYQAWADRYSQEFPGMTVIDVRALIDRSLDAKLQTQSLWLYEIEWIGKAREIWEKEPRTESLLTGRALYDAERLKDRGLPISAEDRSFITTSRAEQDAKLEHDRISRKIERDEASVRDAAVEADTHLAGGKRERIIPVTRHALMERLSDARSWPIGVAMEARRLFRYLDHYRQQQYAAELIDLEPVYEPFNPDSELLVTRKLSDDDRSRIERRIVDRMSWLLESANYTRINSSNIEILLTLESSYGLDLRIDLGAFEELAIYYRGATSRKTTRRSMRTFYLSKEEFDIPIFRRIFLLYKLKPVEARVAEIMAQQSISKELAERQARKLRLSMPTSMREGYIYMKMFKNIPRSDIEMILPNTQVEFRLFDKIKIGVTAGGVVGMGAVGTLAKVAVATNPIALVGAMVGLSGIALRQLINFLNLRNRYMVVMAQNLYSHSLADNRGVLDLLAKRAAEEDFKEEILLYSILSKERVSRAELPEADRAVEMYLMNTFGLSVDLDLEGALERLLKDGIVKEGSDGKLDTLPPLAAAAQIEQRWLALLGELPELSEGGLERLANASETPHSTEQALQRPA